MRRLSVLSLAFAVAACGSGAALDPGPLDAARPTVTVVAGETFSLRIGEVAEVRGEGLTVRFAAVREDSRCPVDVTCVWAGNAAVALQLASVSVARADLVLNTGVEPHTGVVGSHTVELLSVAPEKRQGAAIGPRQYVVALRVARRQG